MRPGGLGRLLLPDQRDWRLERFLGALEGLPDYKYWWSGDLWIDQDDGSCTGAGLAKLRSAGPVSAPAATIDYWDLYIRNQRNDPWPGEYPSYEGATVRAAMKTGVDLGWFSAYAFCWDLETALAFVMTKGPLQMGLDWFSSFDYPDREGIVRLDVNSRLRGGHSFVWDGTSLKRGLARCPNSWGRRWGKNGYFYVPLEDMEALIQMEGECAAPVEVKEAA